MLEALKTTLINVIYPPRCLACAEATDAPGGLCPGCWRDTHFILGTTCAKCGTPLIGDEGVASGPADLCEGCQRHPPTWDRGRAAVLYRGAARKVILGLKHGDRLDMVKPLAGWMATAGRPLLAGADLIAPVPLHWRRLLRRRYNQSAELARRLAGLSGKPTVVDLLTQGRFTTPQEGMNRDTRLRNQAGAFHVTPRRADSVRGAAVLLIDDVLTSGATLSACADTLRAAGAARVDVLVLARVAFDD